MKQNAAKPQPRSTGSETPVQGPIANRPAGKLTCPTSEREPQAHLKLPHLSGAANLPEQAGVQRTRGIAQVHQIKCVGGLTPRLQTQPLTDLESACEREIHDLVSRPSQQIPLRIAVRAGGWNLKRAGVEPRRGDGRARTVWIQVRIAFQVRTVVVVAVQIHIRAGGDVEWQTALQRNDAG